MTETERDRNGRGGLLRAVGLKFGRWLDVVTMQRSLGAGDGAVPLSVTVYVVNAAVDGMVKFGAS